MNTVIISGYLQNDVKLATSSSGKDYASFVVYNRTGSGSYENKNYFNCVCFGQTAKNLSAYKKKGDFIYIVGEVNIKKYEAKDGTKKEQISITVNSVDFPPVSKVNANDIERPYDQTTPGQMPFTQDDIFQQTGMDGTFNPQQVQKAKEKPYIPFDDFKSDLNIDPNDLPF